MPRNEEYMMIAERQRRRYEDGEYRPLLLLGDSTPYHPELEKRDSDAIQNADTDSALFSCL